ncbi:hypothetical protein [Secundilactobacillus yichangensis]|uniref:hypothetical protein n=1 Tax=Secundilactobacillus yichangensis TaxID=2799580 RepID=UPI001943DF50|nr:hypothetical protein [Secundilactobacillus yichangensis]
MRNEGMKISDKRSQLTDYEARVMDFVKAFHDGKKLNPEQLRTKAEIDRNNQKSQLMTEIRKGLGHDQRSNHQRLVAETQKMIQQALSR